MNPFADVTKVNWIAVLAATVAGFFIGFLWYGLAFASMWQSLTGITPEVVEGTNMAVSFGISILATFVAAWGLAVLIGKSPSASDGAMTGLFAGLFL